VSRAVRSNLTFFTIFISFGKSCWNSSLPKNKHYRCKWRQALSVPWYSTLAHHLYKYRSFCNSIIFGVESIFSKAPIMEYLHPSMLIHERGTFGNMVLPTTPKLCKITATGTFSLSQSKRSITSFKNSSIPTACSGPNLWNVSLLIGVGKYFHGLKQFRIFAKCLEALQ